MTPRVSILLPAFNAADTLPACLRSVQRQTETRWQCVIVDDGSTDATLACARGFADADRRFVVLPAPHRGIVAALNAGLEHCTGEVVARMDADDLMHRHRLALQLHALDAAPALAGVGCHVRIFPRQHLPDGRRLYERWLNSLDSARRVREEAYVECPVAHPTLMLRTAVLRAVGYRDCDWPEDYDLLLRLLAAGQEIGVVPRRLVAWRDRPERLSRTCDHYALERFTACKAAFLAATLLADVDTYILWGFGDTARTLHRALLRHGKRPAYIVELHPGRLGNTIHGAPVIAPDALARVPRLPLVASVAGAGPRRQIRAALAALGRRELHDFVCAA